MSTLGSFLRNSSIHGLTYVGGSGSGGPVSRAAWAVAVAVSFTAAVVIIQGNVQNWSNQPSVVTTVDVIAVKVKRGFVLTVFVFK